MAPEALAQVLRPLQDLFDPQDYPDLLVGLGSPDDAAVYRMDRDRALIVTTDFFTPIVDEPYEYGAIAAANALSDVYAMGGRPLLALNVVAFPADLPSEVLAEVMRGGAEKVREAGAILAGGHSITDPEPKYGLVVVGDAHPDRLLTKAGAQVGDLLVLTKPLGSGVITTAVKRGVARTEEVAAAVAWMARLNRRAAELAVEFHLRAATDITGFGFLGHAMEMAVASDVRFRFHYEAIPWMEGATRLAQEWVFPGGSQNNRAFYSPFVTFANGLVEWQQMLLFDAQTSGGLLLAVPPDRLDRFLARAKAVDQPLWVVGEVVEGEGIEIV